jgi:hypothetical protein
MQGHIAINGLNYDKSERNKGYGNEIGRESNKAGKVDGRFDTYFCRLVVHRQFPSNLLRRWRGCRAIVGRLRALHGSRHEVRGMVVDNGGGRKKESAEVGRAKWLCCNLVTRHVDHYVLCNYFPHIRGLRV